MIAASSAVATALLAEFARLGVRDVVVCPGSRSQALALAAAAAERAGALRLHVRIDERSAGFFALGIARETGVPAPVIVTSGTAVANLLPAALEAHEGRVPMVLLTADRPAELRGTRSNQSTRQAGLFDAAARLMLDVDADAIAADAALTGDACAAADAVADVAGGDTEITVLAQRVWRAALGRRGGEPAGPVQVNLQFREPLSGDGDALGDTWERLTEHLAESGAVAAAAGAAQNTDAADAADASGAETYTHTGDSLAVVVAGEGAGDQAATFAERAGLPLLAEVVSGARYGRESISTYATLIDDPDLGGLIERAIVFGHPTLTRQVPALLQRDDVEAVVVDPHVGTGVDHYTPAGTAQTARVVRAAQTAGDYDPRAMRRWLRAWVDADRELLRQRTTVHEPDLDAARETGYKERNTYARTELSVLREPVTRELLVESVWRATWPHDRLVLASSRLVRVLDAIAPSRRLEVRSNRGLAGIDGTVATALGVATASQQHESLAQAAGATRVLLGDLALLHDAGSLLLAQGEPQPRIQLIVGNDGGGTIFDLLEVAESADPAAFDRVMLTPQEVELEHLAHAYGWAYRRIATRGELERLLTEPVTGPSIVEVPLARR